MVCVISITRFFTSILLTVCSIVFMLFTIVITYLKNPFKSPWESKMKLEPPARLSDPKYGIHKYVKANNIKLHYVESGDSSKPLILFLHGFPEFWYSWRHQIVYFNKDYRCIALDLRGYGDSERPEGISHYKMEILVEDIRDFIRQCGVEKCIIVAHDWGGLIACRFRDLYPDVLNGLVLLASSSAEALEHQIWNSPKQRKMSWYMFGFHAPCIPELTLQLNDLQIFDKFMKMDNIEEEDIECFKYWFRKALAFTPPINYYRANKKVGVPEKYHEELVPFLVANASDDLYLSHELLDTMKKSYAHIETTIVQGCGHFIQQDVPQKVNEIIKDFLMRHKL